MLVTLLSTKVAQCAINLTHLIRIYIRLKLYFFTIITWFLWFFTGLFTASFYKTKFFHNINQKWVILCKVFSWFNIFIDWNNILSFNYKFHLFFCFFYNSDSFFPLPFCQKNKTSIWIVLYCNCSFVFIS